VGYLLDRAYTLVGINNLISDREVHRSPGYRF
jgi:hypothetical protein